MGRLPEQGDDKERSDPYEEYENDFCHQNESTTNCDKEVCCKQDEDTEEIVSSPLPFKKAASLKASAYTYEIVGCDSVN
ncbi:hypothetical protein MCY_00193 [Bartonella rattimassiliensis 15908]|uniref:Uncharacterized protein n=2 Tax=Bartonella rattimassiliensis TaxID=270250 RepID=J0QV94_9HYPH|nr:hypothetical protein MCY_00193 [Bartonella rattimassiliensis 15908]